MLDHIEEFAGLATAVFRVAFPRAPWAWKDPRLTVLLPFWERVLGTQPVLFPHRDPGGVARSICRRDGLSPDLGLAIWERHARLALAAMAGRSVAVASYSRLCADPEGWRSEMASFCADVGLSVQVPSDSARAYVLDVPAPTSDEIPLSAAQASLYDIVRSLEGTHLEFPRIDAPREDASVGRRIAAISRRTRTRRRRPRGLLHHRW